MTCCACSPTRASRPGGASWPRTWSRPTPGHPCPPLPVTERLTAGSLILPLFHELTEEEQDLVVSVVHAAAGLPASQPASGMTPAPGAARWSVRASMASAHPSSVTGCRSPSASA